MREIIIVFLGAFLGTLLAGVLLQKKGQDVTVTQAKIQRLQKVREQLIEVIMAYRVVKDTADSKMMQEKELLQQLELLSVYFPQVEEQTDQLDKSMLERVYKLSNRFFSNYYEIQIKRKPNLSQKEGLSKEISEMLTKFLEDPKDWDMVPILKEKVNAYLEEEWILITKGKKFHKDL